MKEVLPDLMRRRPMKKVLPNLMRREIGARGAQCQLDKWGEKQTIPLLGVHLTLTFDTEIKSIAFDKNGEHIACAHSDGTLRILKSSTGECSKMLDGERFAPIGELTDVALAIESLSFLHLSSFKVQYNPNPEEKFKLACRNRNGDNAVTLWDKEGNCLKSLTLGAPVCSVSFDVEGGVLAVAADRLFAWDTTKNMFHLLHRRAPKAVICHPCLSSFMIIAMASREDFSGRPLPPGRFAGVPPLVKLKIWDRGTNKECGLTIPHVVLHSEKGVAISPNGRLVAVCVARQHPDCVGDDDTSHSSVRRTVYVDVVYELRIYSLQEPTFGDLIASQNCKMVSNLTSIQFSPTSEHLLLAFGGNMNILKVCTEELHCTLDRILEVRTVPELELVWHLDDAADSVNVALFHPLVGQGLVYCTRWRKFHILMADLSRPSDPTHD
ncbi:hypothetical protein AKJ16_DCAP03039 [Drosera capensis]